MERLLIIGASDAGISVGLRARELEPGLEHGHYFAEAQPGINPR